MVDGCRGFPDGTRNLWGTSSDPEFIPTWYQWYLYYIPIRYTEYIYIIYLSLLYTYIYIYTYPYYRSLPKFSIPNEMKPLEACGDAGQTAAGAYLHQYFGVAQLLRILAGDRYAASCQLPPVVQFGPVPSQPWKTQLDTPGGLVIHKRYGSVNLYVGYDRIFFFWII